MKATFQEKAAIKEAVGSNGGPREYPWMRIFERRRGWVVQVGKDGKLEVTWSDLMTIDAKTRQITTDLSDVKTQKCLDAIVEYWDY